MRDPNDKWRVSIDGSAFRKIKPKGSETVLAENLKPGTHKLLFVRSTEGCMGTTKFYGFELDDGAKLEQPDPLRAIMLMTARIRCRRGIKKSLTTLKIR